MKKTTIGGILFSLCLAASSFAANAAQVIIVNGDPDGYGLNDEFPAFSDGGNNGVTRGELRLNAVRYAADLVASKVVSPVPIEVHVSSDFLTCEGNSATLASGRPTLVGRDVDGLPRDQINYPVALINALTGQDLLPPGNDLSLPSDDVRIVITTALEEDINCLRLTTFYYGFDGNANRRQIDFVSVVAHEMLHGLGFSSSIDAGTGALSNDVPNVFDTFVASGGVRLVDMSQGDRAQAAVSDNVIFNGVSVRSGAGAILSSGFTLDGVPLYAPLVAERGSSLSHWDDSVSPDQLMEPAVSRGLAVSNDGVGLSACVLSDLGWSLAGAGCPAGPVFSLSAWPVSIDFGQVNTGAQASQSITLTNPGTAQVFISSISDLALPFSVSAEDCTASGQLRPGDSCEIEVTYSPMAQANVMDEILIESNAGEIQIPISANGCDEVNVAFSEHKLAFGDVDVGSSKQLQAHLKNGGCDVVSIGAPEISGPFSSGIASCPDTLAPGEGCVIDVVFSPSDPGRAVGQLNIDTQGLRATVVLEGTGWPTEEEVDPVEPDPTDPADPGDVGPVEPDPTDPADPGDVGPVEPDPVDPTDPGDVGPVEPDPTDPADPGDVGPVEPDPTDPGGPSGPGGPNNPVTPVDPGDVDPEPEIPDVPDVPIEEEEPEAEPEEPEAEPETPVDNGEKKGGGGGCTLSDNEGPIDPLFALMLIGAAAIVRRKKGKGGEKALS